MRRIAVRWGVIALILTGAAALLGAMRGGGTGAAAGTLVSSSCTNSSGFCVSSPSSGPVLYPGAAPSSFPLTFTNSMSVGISVYQFTVTFTNVPANCSSSAFQVSGKAASGSPAAVTVSLATPVFVQAGSSYAYPATLALADNGQDQSRCANAGLSMSYQALANYTVPTTTTLTSSPNPSFGSQPVTLTATVAPNITPVSAGSTPAGTVTFYQCSTPACSQATGTSLGSSALSSGVATLTHTFTQLAKYYLIAVYTPTDATNFSGSSSSSTPLTQVVQCSSSIATKQGQGLTVNAGQDVCITLAGSVGSSVTVNGGGRLDVLGGTINGSLTIQTGGALNFQAGTLNAALTSTGATLFNVCGASLKSWANVSGSTGFVLIGDAGDKGESGCAGNTLSGSLSLSNNTAGVEVGGNTTIAANVTVSGTTGSGPTSEDAAPEIEGNKISGNLSCSGNTPAPTNDGLPNTVSSNRSGQCGAPGF
jgi:hypothetical protein